MRRFFLILFLLSVSTTAAAYYWRTYQPEQTVIATAPEEEGNSGILSEKGRYSRRSLAPEAFSPQAAPVVAKEPSSRQDLAMMISLVSSVVSAIAAIFQTWMTARSFRNRA